MNHGKHIVEKPTARRHIKKSKPSLLLVALVVLVGVLVGSTVAYLITNTGSVANSFTPAKITTDITEDFDGSVKNNVCVTNTGDVEAYIRAAVVVTWKCGSDVYPTAPVPGTDYTMTCPADAGWVQSGSYYYYTSAVAPNASTGVLLTGCQPLHDAPATGYTLHVEILTEAIQSTPGAAVTEAWGVAVGNDGNLAFETYAGGIVG